jgi:hypothetical protein
MLIVFNPKNTATRGMYGMGSGFITYMASLASTAVTTTKNYYTGAMANAKRLMRGIGW